MATDETLEVLLRQVCKIHTNKVNKILDGVGLHIGQPMMLRSLYKNDGVPQSILAKELVITPATASAMVKRLEKGGYVIRKRDAEDERVSNVYLTEKGRELSSQLRALKDQMEDLVFDGFATEEKQMMRNYLNRVMANLED